jgi:hypothetical protein
VRPHWHERPTGRARALWRCGSTGKTVGEADIRLLRAEVEKVAQLKVEATCGAPNRSGGWRSARSTARSSFPDITCGSDSFGVALGTMRYAAAAARKQAAANLQAADAIKCASSAGSDVINEILAGNPQGLASDPFALLENRQPRQITG